MKDKKHKVINMVNIVIAIIIIVIVSVFSAQNADPVSISFFAWKFHASLALVIFMRVERRYCWRHFDVSLQTKTTA